MLTEQAKQAATEVHAIISDVDTRLFNCLISGNMNFGVIGEIQQKLRWAADAMERAKNGF